MDWRRRTIESMGAPGDGPHRTGRRMRWTAVVVAMTVALTLVAVPSMADGTQNEPVRADMERTQPSPVGQFQVGFAPGGHFPSLADDVIDREFALMAEAGAGWIRLPFGWHVMERQRGQYRFDRLEQIVDSARRHGLQVLANVAYTPSWARPAGCSAGLSCRPADNTDYARFLVHLVENFAPLGVSHYELWNEPNMAIFWAPQPDPELYVDLVRRSSAALDRAGLDVTLVAGALAPARDLDSGKQVHPVTFLERMYRAGVGDSFDALSFHPYSYPAAPTVDAPWHALTSVTPRLQKVLADHGADVNIWATEYSYPTGTHKTAVTQAQQADWVDDAFDVWRAASTGPLFWFNLRDRGSDKADREDNFGLMTIDWRPKPSWTTFGRAVRARTPDDPFGSGRSRGSSTNSDSSQSGRTWEK